MRTLIFIFFSFFSVSLGCGESNPQELLINIIKHHKKISHSFSKKLVEKILKYSKKYNVSPELAVQIAMAESSFNQKTLTYKKGKELDFGLYQINIRTIYEYKFNKNRILKDIDYSVKTFMIVMSDKQKMCKNKKEPWACYHSKTPQYRKAYVNKINKLRRSYEKSTENFK